MPSRAKPGVREALSESVDGRELDVNDSGVYTKQRGLSPETHETRLCVSWLVRL